MMPKVNTPKAKPPMKKKIELLEEKTIKLYDDFIAHLSRERRSPDSIKTYGYFAKLFFIWVETNKYDLNLIDFKHIEEFIDFVNERGKDKREGAVSQNTENLIRSTLRGILFYNDRADIANKIKLVGVDKKDPIPLTQQQLIVFFDGVHEIVKEKDAHVADWLRLRNKLFFIFFFETGCRISEVCNLTRDRFDLVNNQIIVTGKRKKTRKVNLNRDWYRQYLKLSQINKDNTYVFTTKEGTIMRSRWIETLMQRICLARGLYRNPETFETFTPHDLRKTYATEMNAPIEVIAKLLGHNSLDTTGIYRKIKDTQLKAAGFPKLEEASK